MSHHSLVRNPPDRSGTILGLFFEALDDPWRTLPSVYGINDAIHVSTDRYETLSWKLRI